MKVVRIAILLLAISVPARSSADTRNVEPRLWDLGLLALATHDLRAQASERSLENIEDSRFNLSTLYASTDGRGIEVLGHQKNTFNTITTSICQYFADFHFRTIAELRGESSDRPEEELAVLARERTVRHFIHHLAISFERVTGLPFPERPIDGDLDNSETIALLVGHDLLPGTAWVLDGKGNQVDRDKDGRADQYRIADRSLDMHVLTMVELQQPVMGFDGEYDPAFMQFSRKEDGKIIDLRAIDRMVIGYLDPAFDFDGTLTEVKERKSIQGTAIEAGFISAMAKGISPVRQGKPVAFVPTSRTFLEEGTPDDTNSNFLSK